MEAVGLIASCVNIIQGLEEIGKLARANIHSSGAVSKELGLLLKKLSAFKSLIEGVQLQAEFNKTTCDRLSVADHVGEALEACELSTAMIMDKMKRLPKRLVFGKIIDKDMAANLKAFEDALPILQFALDADQRVLSMALGNYVKVIDDNLSLMRAENEAIKDDVSEVKRFVTDEQARLRDRDWKTESQQLREWITQCNPTEFYRLSSEKALPGSGRWFLERDFDPWLRNQSDDNHPRILWLHGSTGTGKTTLLSSAISYLKNAKGRMNPLPFAYFYCSFSVKESQSVVNMLGSYIVQLCDQIPGLWDLVKSLHTRLESGLTQEPESPKIVDLEKILDSACGLTDNVVLFLDAPNESDRSSEILKVLSQLVSRNDNLQLLVASTEDLEIDNMLSFYDSVLSIRMNYRKVNDDIYRYIETRMQDERRLQRLPLRLQNKITRKLASDARGSFRWADCQLVALVDNARSEAAIEVALQSLAPSLESLYTAALLAIPPPDRGPLRSALLWLSFAIRPLHLVELSEAMVFEEHSTSIDPSQRLFPEAAEDILRRCRTLITYDARTKYVSLAHSSVQQFLLATDRDRDSSPSSAFNFDAEENICLLSYLSIGYLNMTCFGSGYCLERRELDERVKEWPLLKYASEAWPVYLKRTPWHLTSRRQRMESTLKQFFESARQPRGGNFSSWVQIYIPRHLKKGLPLSTPLYYAARAGLVEVARMILRIEDSSGGGSTLEQPGGSRQSTPLHVACAFGHAEVINLLLESGADLKERNIYGERGIEWAAVTGYSGVVRTLLDKGAEPISDERVEMIARKVKEYRYARHRGLPGVPS